MIRALILFCTFSFLFAFFQPLFAQPAPVTDFVEIFNHADELLEGNNPTPISEEMVKVRVHAHPYPNWTTLPDLTYNIQVQWVECDKGFQNGTSAFFPADGHTPNRIFDVLLEGLPIDTEIKIRVRFQSLNGDKSSTWKHAGEDNQCDVMIVPEAIDDGDNNGDEVGNNGDHGGPAAPSNSVDVGDGEDCVLSASLNGQGSLISLIGTLLILLLGRLILFRPRIVSI